MSFTNDINKFAKKTNRAAEAIFRGTSLDLFTRIIRRTPVDQGFLKGGWQAKINAPAQGTTGIADKSGGQTINRANEIVSKAKLGDSIYLINNLPYAKAIEDGHSQEQAPAGMVKVTVAEFQSIVKKNARTNKA